MSPIHGIYNLKMCKNILEIIMLTLVDEFRPNTGSFIGIKTLNILSMEFLIVFDQKKQLWRYHCELLRGLNVA